jgi:acyl carrier protein
MNQSDLETSVLRQIRERSGSTLADATLRERHLDELALDSMSVLALLVGLEREAGLDFERVARRDAPKTVAELLTLAAYGCAPGAASEPLEPELGLH